MQSVPTLTKKDGHSRLFCGGGWTRTTELIRGQIYSLLQLPLCDSPKDLCAAKLRLFMQSATFFIKFFQISQQIMYQYITEHCRNDDA